jgi:hypothetical protein
VSGLVSTTEVWGFIIIPQLAPTNNGQPGGLNLSMFAAAVAAAAGGQAQQVTQQQQGLAALLASLKQQNPAIATQPHHTIAAPSLYAFPASNMLPPMFQIQQPVNQQQTHSYGPHTLAPSQLQTNPVGVDLTSLSLQSQIAALLGSTAASQQMHQPHYLQQPQYPQQGYGSTQHDISHPVLSQLQTPTVASSNNSANQQQKAIEDFLRSAVAQVAAAAVVTNSSAPAPSDTIAKQATSKMGNAPAPATHLPVLPAPSGIVQSATHLPNQIFNSRPTVSSMRSGQANVGNLVATAPLLSDMQLWPLEKLGMSLSQFFHMIPF